MQQAGFFIGLCWLIKFLAGKKIVDSKAKIKNLNKIKLTLTISELLLNPFTPTHMYGIFHIKSWTIPF